MMSMNAKEIQEKINSYSWQKWLERPFDCFMVSLFQEGIKEKYFEKIGVSKVCCEAILFQNGFWYESPEVFEKMKKGVSVYLEDHTIFEITSSLSSFHSKSKQKIKKLVREEKNPIMQLQELHEILSSATTYIWLAHGLEEYYKEKLKQEVPKYISSEIDLFIGDASFPKKKNAHTRMEEAMRRGISSERIAKKWGWIRIRDGFSEPFTKEEIQIQKENVSSKSYLKKIKIPIPLRLLFNQVQELVYFRTARTDVFYELLFQSRPILRNIAKYYNISFNELRHYSIQTLLSEKPIKNFPLVSFASYLGNGLYSQEVLVKEAKEQEELATLFVKGMIACKGIVRGKAKIVRAVAELQKVEKGDILITQMTFPSFIIAMQRAAGFVTDEGGLTCHAAIVAREMQKPCIIGTRKATTIFNDNDLVEVNANTGIVKKCSKIL